MTSANYDLKRYDIEMNMSQLHESELKKWTKHQQGPEGESGNLVHASPRVAESINGSMNIIIWFWFILYCISLGKQFS